MLRTLTPPCVTGSSASFTSFTSSTSATNSDGSGTYTYDGNGQRVKKIGGGNTIVTVFAGSQVLAEYYNNVAPSSPTNEYIYAGSLRIASIQSGTTDYWHNDHLSPRVRTDTSGNVADQRGTFPFGETWYSPSGSPYIFTTYYRDYEAEGNDYAQARTYVGGLGRFSSPDPIAGSTSDPQSLNRYSYVMDSPTNSSDPLGLCDVVSGGITQTQGSASTQAQETFANSIGADQAFPSSGQGVAAGLAGMESRATTDVLRNAINDAAAQTPNGQSMNIFLFSGAADAFSNVYPTLSSDVRSKIRNITYLSPGLAPGSHLVGNLSRPSNVFLGNGVTENLVTTISDLQAGNGDGINLNFYDCGHNANCAFTAASSLLQAQAGPACTEPKTFVRQANGGPSPSRGGGSGSGNMNGGGGLAGIDGWIWVPGGCVTAAGETTCDPGYWKAVF
jgi:RHS repeat-associated protein